MFEAMRRIADENGIELRLICGQPSKSAASRKDEGFLEWVNKVKNLYIPIEERKDLCWQPTPAGLPKPDLVIVMQENRILSNYSWLLKRALGGPKVAYWGHGRDLQSSNPDSLRNRFKRSLVSYTDWYFGYTELSRDILMMDGYPDEQITVVNNAIDTVQFRQDLDAVTTVMQIALHTKLKLPKDVIVGLYCGSLYPDKKLGFLVDACKAVHHQDPRFHLVVIGEGPSLGTLQELTADQDWIRLVGQQRDIEKAAYFSSAIMLLNPGGVGLHVLDAFTSGVPLVTTGNALHGPEIAYLENGKNGVITSDSSFEYAAAVQKIIGDSRYRQALASAAREASLLYSVENMASRFVEGMLACLQKRGEHG
ncbi:MAG: glycosyltransferase family 4 protein [Accumulibacter sp.]